MVTTVNVEVGSSPIAKRVERFLAFGTSLEACSRLNEPGSRTKFDASSAKSRRQARDDDRRENSLHASRLFGIRTHRLRPRGIRPSLTWRIMLMRRRRARSGRLVVWD